MIHSTVRIALPAKRLSEALGILCPLAERIRVEHGCLVCRVYKDVQEDNVLMFEEVWQSDVDANRHLRSHQYRELLLVMELAVAAPEVRFDTVSQSTGFETIESARA
jgi:quinol monooxygenase YgiN